MLAQRPVCALLAGFTLLAAGSARAQTVTLDEGVFRLIVAGQEVGTENFSIRQNGTGADAVIIAQGRTVLSGEVGEELNASLEVSGAALRPAAYQITVRGADQQRIAGRVVGGRFSARIISPTGEMMREYLASEGAVLLDQGVAHHFYFLARRLDGASAQVPILIPRQNRQVSAAVSARGNEMIEVGGTQVEARRLSVQPSGGDESRVWVDGQGRVLRVEVPARKYVAERRAMPR